MGVPLSDLISSDQLARLRSAAGGSVSEDAVTGAVEVKSAAAPADLEVKGPDVDEAVAGGMEHKAAPTDGGAQVLSADDETGIVEALVSVTGIEDRVKDIIEPGAYTKTLANREPIGVWSHDDKTWVARTESARELMPGDPFLKDLKTMDGKPWDPRAGAVHVKARFNLDTPHGKAAYSDVKFFQGKTGWSIGYRATKAHRDPRTGVRNIKELDWFEYSPVMVGAASQPMTLSVKSLAQPVDADDATGLVDEAVLEQLSPAELDRLTELKASLGLEVKDRVRTPEGARRYGQPIGTEIVKDSVKADALKVGDHVDFQGMGPGGPSDPIAVHGKVEKVAKDGNVIKVTVDGKDHKLLASSPVDVVRAKAPGEAAPPADGGRVSPVMKDAIAKASDEKLTEIAGRVQPNTPDNRAILAAIEKEQATRKSSSSSSSASGPGDLGSYPQGTQISIHTGRDRRTFNMTEHGWKEPGGSHFSNEAVQKLVDAHGANVFSKAGGANSDLLHKLPAKPTTSRDPKTMSTAELADAMDGFGHNLTPEQQAIDAEYRSRMRGGRGGQSGPPKVPAGGLNSSARSSDNPANNPEAARLRDQRQQAATDRERRQNAEADAKVKEHQKLAALNKRRRAKGQPPLLRLPQSMKSLDFAEHTDDELEAKVWDALDAGDVEFGDPEQKALAHENLNRSPKVNWVERAGQLPAYIQHIAKDIHEQQGLPLDRAIPIAIGRVKKWAKGGGGVKPDTVAKAQAAVAEWEALKAKAHAKFDSEVLDYLERKQAEVAAAVALLVEEGLLEAKDADVEEAELDLGADDFDLVDELLAGAVVASEADTAAAAAAALEDAELEEAKADDEPVEDLSELLRRGAELKSFLADSEEPPPFS